MAACLPRKVPRHTRPQAPWPRTSPNLGMGGGCAQGKWVGKCALWLWLWPWQPKPCPVRTTARSKSSKSFPFPLTEETHTEGHTSKNLASLPGEPRPEDKIPQRKRKIHMGFYLCIEKCLSKKFEEEPACAWHTAASRHTGPTRPGLSTPASALS